MAAPAPAPWDSRAVDLAFQDAPQPCLLVDPANSTVLAANAAACRILGYSPADLRAAGWRRLVVPTAGLPAGAVEQPRALQLRPRGGAPQAWSGKPVPGGWLLLTLAPGAPQSVDPAALEEEAVRFAYAAFHDLKEPVQLVRGYLGLLATGATDRLDHGQVEMLTEAINGAERLQHQLHDVLEYFRIGARGPTFEPVDLDQVVTGTLAELAFAIRDSKASIDHGPLPQVHADRRLMIALFQNLLSNAVKFHVERPPKIRIEARQTPDAWEFTVADNGVGIPAADRDRIFRPFQRLHPVDRYPGTGLGLSICRRIVEAHGGRIWVEANPEGGTRMKFTLAGGPA